MADGELIDMASQFKGLPMADLIGGPLRAACDAQIALANATATFVKVVGFKPPTEGDDANAVGDIRTAQFKFTRSRMKDDGTGTEDEDVVMDVPLLAIVKVPSLFIDTVDITFDMEVKSSSSQKESEDKAGKFSADMEAGWAVSASRSMSRARWPPTRRTPARPTTRPNTTSRFTPRTRGCPKGWRGSWTS